MIGKKKKWPQITLIDTDYAKGMASPKNKR